MAEVLQRTLDPQSKLVVLGNGPSLRNFDLTKLSDVHTLGMNAAYRHWDRIGWYPDIYCCLDDELITTHWQEIKRLVNGGLVGEAFLSGHFLNFVPEAAHDNRFSFLDSFVEYWYQTRGKRFGLDLIHHPAFKSSNSEKLTTGSHAVRFGIMRGYKRIALMGIDLKYVERIPESRAVGGIKLEITKTPTHNPNYFFDDYQQAGDTFQVPNPDAHHGNLHLASFEVLRNDLVRSNLDIEVVNTSLSSALHENAVLPFQSIDTFLNRALLGAVVVPTNIREREAILNNIWLWDQPAFTPFLHMRNREPPRLVFSFNNETSRQLEPEIAAAFENTITLKTFFSGLEFRYLSLHGEDDVYVRDGSQPVGPKGFKAGPNNQFFDTIRDAAGLGKYIFYMETDCVPIRGDWLGTLQDLVQHSEPFWVLGSIYRGKSTLARAYCRHINGNAIYAAGDPTFQDFIATVWQPALQAIVSRDPQYAYDMMIETISAAARPTNPDDCLWQFVQSTAHKFRYTDAIQNYSGQVDVECSDANLIQTVLRDSPGTYLLHGHSFLAAVRKLRQSGITPDGVLSLQLERPRRNGFDDRVIEDASEELGQTARSTPSTAHSSVQEFISRFLDARDDYKRAVFAITDFVAANVPEDVTLAVISKGDDDLLRMGDRRAWHFPRAADGSYLGHYPADDLAAKEQLQNLRSLGADYLVLPKTALWWLKHYVRFGEQLFAHCRSVVLPEHSGIMFELKSENVNLAEQLAARRLVDSVVAAKQLFDTRIRLVIETLLSGRGSQVLREEEAAGVPLR